MYKEKIEKAAAYDVMIKLVIELWWQYKPYLYTHIIMNQRTKENTHVYFSSKL